MGARPVGLCADGIYLEQLRLASVYPSGVQYVHSDHLGNPRKVTDASGNVKAYSDFYPFGLPAATNGIQGRWFSGYELEPQNTASAHTDDLYFLHARWYFPLTGRFLSPDPVRGNPKSPQSFNLYAYVQDNPINAADPDGRMANFLTPSRERAMMTALGEVDFFYAAAVRMWMSGMLWYVLGENPDGGGSRSSKTAVKAYEGEDGSTVIEYSDGSKEIRKGGSRAWRNNNPGNLVFGGEATTGAIGTAGGIPGTSLKFAVFPTEAAGTAALLRYLQSPANAKLTVSSLIEKYAPPAHNDTNTYKQFVAKQGIPLEAKMGGLAASQLSALVAAIRRMEGWTPGTVTWEAAK